MGKKQRWKAVALLATGIAIGVVMIGTPAGAHVSSWAHNWNKHIKPKADQRYVKKAAIRTIQGNYAIGGDSSNDAWSEIDFGFALASAPEEHFIPEATVPPAECPGSVTNPQAMAGHLCVYEENSSNRDNLVIFSGATGTTNTANRWGAGLWLLPTVPGDYFSYGTWAVKAPAGTTPSRVAAASPAGPKAGE